LEISIDFVGCSTSSSSSSQIRRTSFFVSFAARDGTITERQAAKAAKQLRESTAAMQKQIADLQAARSNGCVIA